MFTIINGFKILLLPKKMKSISGYRNLASAAPSTTIEGALSPPIASNDILIFFKKTPTILIDDFYQLD